MTSFVETVRRLLNESNPSMSEVSHRSEISIDSTGRITLKDISRGWESGKDTNPSLKNLLDDLQDLLKASRRNCLIARKDALHISGAIVSWHWASAGCPSMGHMAGLAVAG